MDTDDKKPLLLTVEKAAESLSVSRATFYGLLKEGKIEGIHIGRRTLIPQGALEEYVERLRASA